MEYKGEPRVIHERRDLKRLTRRRQFISQVLGVIVIILLLLLCITGWIGWNNTNTIEKNVCNPLKNAKLSINCTDGNPCTTDRRIAIPTTGCSGSGVVTEDCVQYACEYIHLADGACCNMNDFCYFDDPNKKCMLGSCITNASLCKGYCIDEDSGTCPELPFITADNMLSVSTQCFNHSCIYTAIVEMYIADPYSLLANEPTNLLYFNTTSCLSAICDYGFLSDVFYPEPYLYSTCTYVWSCAPFLFPTAGAGKKRDEVEAGNETFVAVPFNGHKMYGKAGRRLPPPYSLFSTDIKSLKVINLTNEATMPITSYPMLNFTAQHNTDRAKFNALKSLFQQHKVSVAATTTAPSS